MKKVLPIILLITLSVSVIAQQRGNRRFNADNSIKGRVLDFATKHPLEYANIVLIAKRRNIQAGGTITNSEGYFKLDKLRPGIYKAKISFIGYNSVELDSLFLRPGTNLDLGDILLKAKIVDTEEVIVEGNRSPITYEIDKKVINVNEQITSLSGTAVDVLENVPSITVDIEGNVSLRGSQSFTLLIDGRPSVLDANEALQQIPATSIENIEIITNPSAKFDPEGAAGIINIILKKNKLKGLSGILSLNGSTLGSYGGNFITEYKREGWAIGLGADFNKRNFDSESNSERWQLVRGTKYFDLSNGSTNRSGSPYGLRGYFSYDISDNDLVKIDGRLGNRTFQHNSNLFYTSFDSFALDTLLSNTANSRKRSGLFYSAALNYTHKFNGNSHKLSFDFNVRNRGGEEESVYKQFDFLQNVISGQKNTESGPSNSYDIKLDYTLPIANNGKFESGLRGDFDESTDNTEYFDYVNGDFVKQNLFSRDVNYKKNIYAAYVMASNNFGPLGFQAGLRGEYTDRLITLNTTGEEFTIKRWDYFPTLHSSLKLPAGNQLMASYTKRIRRPRGWRLEPFITYVDPYNIRQGDPDLQPEYIDSYELGYQKYFNRSLLSIELYYRIRNNKIENIRVPFDSSRTLMSFVNVGKDFSFGTEFMLNFDLLKFWNVSLMGNLYDYKIEGELERKSFNRNSFNWNVRFNNNLTLSENLKLQFNAFYNSPSVSAQGERKGFFMFNAGIRYSMLDKKLDLTLQARDLFSTAKFENITDTDYIYSFSEFRPDSPSISLNIKFNFNNYKQQRNGERRGDTELMPGDEEEF